jgi:transposase InsO family protein
MPEAERKSRIQSTAARPRNAGSPFQITSMDIIGPYPLTPRRNKYIITFIDHITKFVEAFAIPDQSAQTCARIYATEIVTRHGSGSKLVTDQGAAFMSSFFSETCKVLGVQKSRTSSYHPSSNGTLERWHRALHDGMSHYVNSSHSNWNFVLPFF